jgi:ATP-binding cassette subfamily B protein
MQPLKQLLGFTKGMKRIFLIIAATSVAGAALSLVQPFIIKFATDWVTAILGHRAEFSWGMILLLGALVLASALISAVITDVGGYFGDQMAVRVRFQLSTKYFGHLLKLPQRYYDNEITGTIINRLSRAITDITNFLQFFSNNLLQMLLTIGITIVILVVYSWPLALLFALLIPANLYLTARTSGPWQEIEKKKNGFFDVASGRFGEVVGQMRLVKSFGTARQELKVFSDEMGQMIPLTQTQSKQWHKMNALRSAVFGLINGVILAVLFYETASGKFSLGDMTMLLALISQVSFPMRNLSFFVDSYQRAVANSRDYLKALDEEPEPSDRGRRELKVTRGKVEYRDVDFRYDEDGKQVLRDVSFTIEPGTKLALVGESGGGKTTISNLLMSLYEPNSGQVCIDGQDLATRSRGSVRAQVATVFQDAALFSGTIRENIAYANPDASMEEIEEAARSANAEGFIKKFPNGYDTEIGERGIKLSGGQKQRLSIARALLKNAPILILDEATSSLDSRAERDVQVALDRLMKNRTTLIIAHRLSTIAGVDRIVTLKDGRVDEVGSPQELATTGGIYAQLLELQLGTTKTAKKQLAKFDINA